MMLHFFTWQQFLVAAVIFTIGWYVVIFLVFFKGKIKVKLPGKGKQPERIRRDWDEELEEEQEDDLIGEQALPEGISEVEAHMLGFAPKVHAPHEDDEASREMQMGLVPDVLEELKTIFHILERDNGTKEDFFSLFALVKAKYAGIAGTSNEAAIGEYIRENVLFPISDDELTNLWN